MSRRGGLSRVEVLAAMFTAVLVAGLALAAVGRVREPAARTRCTNNLRQLALTVHNYTSVDKDGRLPPLTDQGEGARTSGGLLSVFATLIPYVEATPLFYRPDRPPSAYHAHSSVPFTYPNKDGTTGTVGGGIANQFWTTFTDPADNTANRLRDVPMTLPDGTTGHYAAGSYAANGLLPWGTGNLPGFPHGSANTILFGERPQVCRTAAGEVVYNLWGVGFYSPHMPAFATLTPTDPPGLWSTGQFAPAAPLPEEGVTDREARILVRVGRQDAPAEPSDFPTPIQLLRGGRPCDPRLPASPHLAGMQVAMADGSVRVFGPDTAPWVFWSACMPAAPTVPPHDGR